MMQPGTTMLIPIRRAIVSMTASALVLLGVVFPNRTAVADTYTYDELGRVTTVLYDNGLCIVYAYDPNGNRISQVNTISSTPESPVWGAGVWGCARWTPH